MEGPSESQGGFYLVAWTSPMGTSTDDSGLQGLLRNAVFENISLSPTCQHNSLLVSADWSQKERSCVTLNIL